MDYRCACSCSEPYQTYLAINAILYFYTSPRLKPRLYLYEAVGGAYVAIYISPSFHVL